MEENTTDHEKNQSSETDPEPTWTLVGAHGGTSQPVPAGRGSGGTMTARTVRLVLEEVRQPGLTLTLLLHKLLQ